MKQVLIETQLFKPTPGLLSEGKMSERGNPLVEGILATAEVKNGNGRYYSKDLWDRELDKYQELIKENRATGELDHPDDSVINLKNVSHLIVECWWQGNDVMGKIKVLDTPSGRILKDLINAGVKLGISSRGLGSVNEDMNGQSVVAEDFQLICFDIVSEPSTPDAYVYPDEKRRDLGSDMFKVKMRENKENQIDNLFSKILRD